MSYRALLTIKDAGQDGRHFMVPLGDLWDQAERLAEIALKAKSAPRAITDIHEVRELGLNPQLRLFDSPESLEAWIDTYADQTWEVEFVEVGGYVQGTITGKDAGGTMIFFRQRVWAID